MQKVICPSCQTSYDLPDNSIGSTGRKVKCANCACLWIATGSATLSEDLALNAVSPEQTDDLSRRSCPSIDRNETEPAPFAAAQTTVPIDAEFNEEPSGQKQNLFEKVTFNVKADVRGDPQSAFIDPRQLSGFGPQRVMKYKAQKKKPSAGWRFVRPAAVFATIAIITGLIVERNTLVSAAPDLASLYNTIGLAVNVRGLALQDIRSERVVQGSETVLIISGEIENMTDAQSDVPKLRFGLSTNTSEEIFAWNFEPDKETILPGSVNRFQTRLPDPPPLGQNLSVQFAKN